MYLRVWWGRSLIFKYGLHSILIGNQLCLDLNAHAQLYTSDFFCPYIFPWIWAYTRFQYEIKACLFKCGPCLLTFCLYLKQQKEKSSKGLNSFYRHCISLSHTKKQKWWDTRIPYCVLLCVTVKTTILCMTATNWHGVHIKNFVSQPIQSKNPLFHCNNPYKPAMP